jgi:hypothetical protein
MDVPFEGKNENFDPVSSFKERYGVQLIVEKVFMLTVRLQLEIMATDPPKKVLGPIQSPLYFLGANGFIERCLHHNFFDDRRLDDKRPGFTSRMA